MNKHLISMPNNCAMWIEILWGWTSWFKKLFKFYNSSSHFDIPFLTLNKRTKCVSSRTIYKHRTVYLNLLQRSHNRPKDGFQGLDFLSKHVFIARVFNIVFIHSCDVGQHCHRNFTRMKRILNVHVFWNMYR